MKEFIAACVQIAVTPNDVKANIGKGLDWLERAVKEYDADLVVFPETVTTSFVTGMETEELWDLVDEAPGHITHEIQKAAKAHDVHVVWPSYRRGPERGDRQAGELAGRPHRQATGDRRRRAVRLRRKAGAAAGTEGTDGADPAPRRGRQPARPVRVGS